MIVNNKTMSAIRQIEPTAVADWTMLRGRSLEHLRKQDPAWLLSLDGSPESARELIELSQRKRVNGIERERFACPPCQLGRQRIECRQVCETSGIRKIPQLRSKRGWWRLGRMLRPPFSAALLPRLPMLGSFLFFKLLPIISSAELPRMMAAPLAMPASLLSGVFSSGRMRRLFRLGTISAGRGRTRRRGVIASRLVFRSSRPLIPFWCRGICGNTFITR